ncbi:hypothetical protein E2986_05851 [Frieseomelitta varia]|uniref:Nose resistant-to-fluoxetine protein N-terminal domain-containing protein n=1 Tax=Frieseomelitta varia TaxID=561572 RepID=A0A833VKW3_9HYME|nr:hypothetical protein E2986_05851 [Frieseomelitta varia]
MQHEKISSWAWLSLFLLTIFHPPAQGTAETMRQMFPAYALMENIDLVNSSRCRAEMEEFRNGVDNKILWSLRVLDSNGMPSSGFVNGNNFWIGDRQNCKLLSENHTLLFSEDVRKNNSIYRNPKEEFPPFKVHFFAARIRHNSTLQYHTEVMMNENLITLGFCLPASCTNHDIATMLEKVLNERKLLIGELFSANFEIIEITDLVDDHQWLFSAKIIFIVGFLVLFCGLVAVATVYDVLIHKKRTKNKKEIFNFENNNTNSKPRDTSADELKNEIEEKCETDQEDSVSPKSKSPSNVMEYVLCFSFVTNTRQIFKAEESADNVRIFHSMKVLGNLWIILCHIIFYTTHITANKTIAYALSDTLAAQILANGTLSVDTYFFISGFLLTYIFFKGQSKDKKVPSLPVRIKQYIELFVKRYIRLTPAYFVVILLAIFYFTWKDQTSIILPVERVNVVCSKYWWTNMLYINNLYHWNDISSFITSLNFTDYFRHCNTAVSLGVVTLFSSLGSILYFSYTLNFVPTLDKQYSTLTDLYIRPWVRIVPYLVGMAISYLLIKWNYKLHLSKKSLIVGWALSILCNCSILFGLTDKNIPFSLSIIYSTLSRTGWSLGIAWLVVACCTNHGGIICKFLSSDFFVPLSRLTYCAYLVNPFVILGICASRSFPDYIDYYNIAAFFLTVSVISYIIAFLISVTTEVPFIKLLRLYNNRQKRMK